MTPKQIYRTFWLALGAAIVSPVFAQEGDRSIDLETGVQITFGEVIGNLISFLASSITAIATAFFILGALFLVISRGDGDQLKRGKDLMLRSLEGLAIVLGSYGIVRTAIWLLYQ